MSFPQTILMYRWVAILCIICLITVPAPVLAETDEYIFEMTSLVIDIGNFNRVSYADWIIDAFKEAGIKAIFDLDSEIAFDRSIGYGDRPVPLYEDGGFDALFAGLIFTTFDFAGHPIKAENMLIPSSPSNFFNYENQALDDLYDQYFEEEDLQKELGLVRQIQNLLYEDQAVLGIIHRNDVLLYNSTLGIAEEFWEAINWNKANNMIMRSGWAEMGSENTSMVKLGRRDSFVSPFMQPPLGSNPVIGWLAQSMVWQGLYEVDVDTEQYIPLLAKDLPTRINETSYRVHLDPNATFSDGSAVTVDDVVASYRLFLSPKVMESHYLFFHSANFWFPVGTELYNLHTDYLNNDSLVVVDEHTLDIQFLQPNKFPEKYLSLSIMPEDAHYDGLSLRLEDGDYENAILDEIANDTGTSYALGSGPYVYQDVEHLGHGLNSITLVKNENYWKTDVIIPEIQIISTRDFNDSQELEALCNGTLDMIQIWEENRLDTLACSENIEIHKYIGDSTQTLVLNMDHPVYGTGIETPLGKHDPSRTEEAARYVRLAMSHIIPREDLIAELLDELFAVPAATAIPPSMWGSKQLLHHQYDQDLAKEYLKKAGYFGGITSIDDQPGISTPDTENGFLEYYHYLMVLALLPLMKRKRLMGS